MLKKGIIMSIGSSHAIVMEKGGALHHLKPKEAMCIGQTILFTSEDMVQSRAINSSPTYFKQLALIAAALILFIIPTLYTLQTPYAVISLDINPSIELLISKNQVVKKVIGKNNDSTHLNLHSLEGKSLEIALNELKHELESSNIWHVNQPVLVAYTDLRKTHLDMVPPIKAVLETTFDTSSIYYISSTKSDYNAAQKSSLSLGRYMASQLLKESVKDSSFDTQPVSILIDQLENLNKTPHTDTFLPSTNPPDKDNTDVESNDDDTDDVDTDHDDTDDNDTDDNDTDDVDIDDVDTDDVDTDDINTDDVDTADNNTNDNDTDDNDTDDNDTDDNDTDDNDTDDVDTDDNDTDDNDTDDVDTDDDDDTN